MNLYYLYRGLRSNFLQEWIFNNLWANQFASLVSRSLKNKTKRNVMSSIGIYWCIIQAPINFAVFCKLHKLYLIFHLQTRHKKWNKIEQINCWFVNCECPGWQKMIKLPNRKKLVFRYSQCTFNKNNVHLHMINVAILQ